MKKNILQTGVMVALCFLMTTNGAVAQPRPFNDEAEVMQLLMSRCKRDYEYIAELVNAAKQIKRLYDIPVQVTLGVVILESNGTQSLLAKEANNLIGATCSFDWEDKPVFYKDHDGMVTCFRVYPRPADSVFGFADFIMSPDRPWYEDARNCNWDATCWIDGLSEYATDKQWPKKVKDTIANYHLDVFDE
ncbi:MAG: glucosaminidase domain-containing protein [Saprospiraceae bacterium]|nr:glucosaminidase domain-containing protein [Saprospiraceae bacterium]